MTPTQMSMPSWEHDLSIPSQSLLPSYQPTPCGYSTYVYQESPSFYTPNPPQQIHYYNQFYPQEQPLQFHCCSFCKTTNAAKLFEWNQQLLCPSCYERQTLAVYTSPQQVAVPETPRRTCRAKRVCSNCCTTQTPLWRRSTTGQVQCNACSQFEKKNKFPRPESLYKKPSAKRRRYKPTSPEGYSSSSPY